MTSYRPQTPNWSQVPNFYGGGGFNSPSFQAIGTRNPDQIANYVKRITLSPNDRGDAMYTLSCLREYNPNLGSLIWESPAAVAALLTEIISAYPHIASISNSPITSPTSISHAQAVRVCSALTLLQSIAATDEIRPAFLKANIPMYLFPFLHTTNQSRECEYFKLGALAVIGHLAMSESQEVIDYLLNNEFVPLCLRILKFGQEINKILAAYILQKIITDPRGRTVCSVNDRLINVIKVFNLRVADLAKNFNSRLSRNIVAAYESLLQSEKAAQIIVEISSKSEELRGLKLCPECDESFVRLVHRICGNK